MDLILIKKRCQQIAIDLERSICKQNKLIKIENKLIILPLHIEKRSGLKL